MGQQAPRHFDWMIPERLVATALPSSDDLRELKRQGIDVIISLSSGTPSRELLEELSLKHHHFPMSDMSAPEVGLVERFVGILEHELDQGQNVAVHCGAGLGRTGTLLACYFVNEGLSADEAIQRVRKHRPGSIESHQQEEAVHRYAEHLDLKRGE